MDCFSFQQVNIPMNRRSLNRLIDMMDVDGDGEIDFRSYHIYLIHFWFRNININNYWVQNIKNLGVFFSNFSVN